MSAWRRKIIEIFPDLRAEVQAKDASIYLIFSELASRATKAHEIGDAEVLAKVYGFAEWCARQSAKDLWNAAGVSFYEHVVESEAAQRDFPRWVSRRTFEDVASLVEWRVGPEVVARMRAAYEDGGAAPGKRRT